MDYGLLIQRNRNELFKHLAQKNKCTVVETDPVHYMDLRPYIYSSSISEFEVSYADEMLRSIHFNKLPATIFLGESQSNESRIQALLDRVDSYDKLPIMIATQETLTNPNALIGPDGLVESDVLVGQGILLNREPENLDFKAYNIETEHDLLRWCKVLAEGLFDNPDMSLAPMRKLFNFTLADERYLLTLGTVNDEPVSAGIGYISELEDQRTIGGLYMIATAKAYRKRGYGSKLVYKLSKSLFDHGVSFTILDASEMGASLYLKMGYKPVSYSYRFFP
ncbi:GNAT family N-acetyltransferase [Fusibacter ferrireducens]|uniref:GNAT family N-acetyltransferase n=1 Tax=Fusibacter ferrireducens TaxID=2785058 RepID=A0ABR9ZNX9_9FIRM|nr:GNAT family N-acetyltransferase [Fusibacter ferrireducens]MBF4691833.1 GNAT family N-acetyltransferase [Fusibacter ferrireducens]